MPCPVLSGLGTASPLWASVPAPSTPQLGCTSAVSGSLPGLTHWPLWVPGQQVLVGCHSQVPGALPLESEWGRGSNRLLVLVEAGDECCTHLGSLCPPQPYGGRSDILS